MTVADGVMGDDGIVRYSLANDSAVEIEARRMAGGWQYRYGPDDYWKLATAAFETVLDHHHPRPKTVTLQGDMGGGEKVDVVWTRDAEGWTSTEGDSALPHEDWLAAALDALWAAENPEVES